MCKVLKGPQMTARALKVKLPKEKLPRKIGGDFTTQSEPLVSHFDAVQEDSHNSLTLELQMSHICDARGYALSAVVGILRQSNQVALTARS